MIGNCRVWVDFIELSMMLHSMVDELPSCFNLCFLYSIKYLFEDTGLFEFLPEIMGSFAADGSFSDPEFHGSVSSIVQCSFARDGLLSDPQSHGSVSSIAQDSFAGDNAFSGLESLTLIALSYNPKGCTKFTTSGAHDVIEITSLQKNDLCTEELRDRAKTTGRGQSTT